MAGNPETTAILNSLIYLWFDDEKKEGEQEGRLERRRERRRELQNTIRRSVPRHERQVTAEWHNHSELSPLTFLFSVTHIHIQQMHVHVCTYNFINWSMKTTPTRSPKSSSSRQICLGRADHLPNCKSLDPATARLGTVSKLWLMIIHTLLPSMSRITAQSYCSCYSHCIHTRTSTLQTTSTIFTHNYISV